MMQSMTHPEQGTLQALLDDELRFDERAELQSHLAACHECAAELDLLRDASAVLTAVLPRLDIEPDVAQARWRFEARRRQPRARAAGTAVRRAAVLILGSAAVLSATVPGSPVREWLADRWEQTAAPAPLADGRDTEPAMAAGAAEEELPSGVSVEPIDGRMRVVFVAPGEGVRLRVRLHDGARVGVWASGEAADAQFRTSPDRIEVEGVRAGEVRVEIPRAAVQVTLEVNGRVYLRQDGERLRFPGPAADTTGPEILFEVGS